MTTTACTTTETLANTLTEGVMTALPNLRHKNHVRQIWTRERDEVFSTASDSCVIQSPEATASLVKVHTAWVELLDKERELSLARERLKHCQQQYQTDARYFEPDVPDGECEASLFGLGFAVPAPEPDLTAALPAIKMLACTATPAEIVATARGELPAFLRTDAASAASKEFYQDLAAFLIESDGAGAEAVLQILSDAGLARTVATKVFVPKPLLFIARIVAATEDTSR